jgi:hypothetical protein
MKHYYDDNGVLSYYIDRKLLIEFSDALFQHYGTIENWSVIKVDINELTTKIINEYLTRQPLLGFSDDRMFVEPGFTNNDSSVTIVLKKMLSNFVEEGYIHNEFRLVVWSAMCNIEAISILMEF